ncbi:hypothetical protein GTA08_BOTSDO04948 [Botryosphaeria dothidea]|uniref:Uncharacterized protein n=1 Tax=Botryosphaeria dothidea TaxID=55169 RepID=A0A8H4N106_9PEZI|nr:hypothetical protein GTA08_BOTSDO04948 [Botryosphaeria dothidea]
MDDVDHMNRTVSLIRSSADAMLSANTHVSRLADATAHLRHKLATGAAPTAADMEAFVDAAPDATTDLQPIYRALQQQHAGLAAARREGLPVALPLLRVGGACGVLRALGAFAQAWIATTTACVAWDGAARAHVFSVAEAEAAGVRARFGAALPRVVRQLGMWCAEMGRGAFVGLPRGVPEDAEMGGVLRHDDVERTMLLSVLADDLCVRDIDEDARRTLYREYVDLDRVLSR